MKILILFFLIASSFNLYANVNDEESYLCYSDQIDKTVLLKQISDYEDYTQDDWEQTARYKISIQTTELAFPDFVSEGKALNADVFFTYQADSLYGGQEVSFNMYLDELDESSLSIGDRRFDYECNRLEELFVQ